VIDVLSDQFILRGVPEHIRSDNGPSPRPCRTGSESSGPWATNRRRLRSSSQPSPPGRLRNLDQRRRPRASREPNP
jgi:hypothetical protein